MHPSPPGTRGLVLSITEGPPGSGLLILKFVAQGVEFSGLAGGPGSCGEGNRTISPAEAKFPQSASAAEVEFGCSSAALCSFLERSFLELESASLLASA